MIDKDKIFKLFVDGKEISGDKTKDEIKNFMNGPYAKIGMFVKLIQNHEVFHKKLEKFLKKEQPNYNVESTKEASEFTVYNRAWGYIKNININDEEDLNAIINFEHRTLLKVLSSSITFFEIYEEYEKCAHLYKIQKVIKEI
jgi:hypothetical protein|tara:strand:- start:466 stop:891 length:426 start_codon:yes stop_codon:yes gene_type:complete